MKEQLIKLRAVVRETCDRLDVENIEGDANKRQRNLIIQYLTEASIEAGTLLRNLNKK